MGVKEFIQSAGRDGLVKSVAQGIGWLIVTVGGGFVAYLKGWNIPLRELVSVPTGLVWMGGIALGYLVLAGVVMMRVPAWKRYTKDVENGLLWRWKPGSEEAPVRRLEAFCPKDGHRITWENDYDRDQGWGVCYHCGFKTKRVPFSGVGDVAKKRMEQVIERHLNEGTWREANARVKASRKANAASNEGDKKEGDKRGND